MKNFKNDMYRAIEDSNVQYYIGNTFFFSIIVSISNLYLHDNNSLEYIKIETNNKCKHVYTLSSVKIVYFYDRNR